MIEIQNLQKTYTLHHQKISALKGVNLHIKKGQIICIYGPSGSGKTTLLNLIAGLEKPDLGHIIVNQQNIARHAHAGYIFQDFLLIPYLTVSENIQAPCLFNHDHLKTENLPALLKKVGLEHRKNHHPAYISGGEKQRVAIARALILSPEIILADEPTGNLDEETGEKIIELLLDCWKTKKFTLIIASHDQKLLQIAHKVIFLKNGLIYPSYALPRLQKYPL